MCVNMNSIYAYMYMYLRVVYTYEYIVQHIYVFITCMHVMLYYTILWCSNMLCDVMVRHLVMSCYVVLWYAYHL